MIAVLYSFFFILGIAIGSFLGVVVDRLSSQESIWKGRSHCDHCRHNLSVLDLIPIFSFFILGRKCRYCHKKLSWFYPLIEICTGIAYAAIGIVLVQQIGLISQVFYQLLLLYYFLLTGLLLVIFFADIRYGIIPFNVVVLSLFLIIIWNLLSPLLAGGQNVSFHTHLLNSILSAAGAGGFFFLLFAATKGRGMGFGDVIYAFLMGFILGFPRVILGLYIAFVTGAVVSLLLVALKKKKLKGGTIPFGPFLVFGTFVSLLWGKFILAYLFRYFLL